MNCKSTYNNDYAPKRKIMPACKLNKKTPNTFDLISHSKDWMGESQYKWAFKPQTSAAQRSNVVRTKGEAYVPVSNFHKEVASSYKQDFKASNVPYIKKGKRPMLLNTVR